MSNSIAVLNIHRYSAANQHKLFFAVFASPADVFSSLGDSMETIVSMQRASCILEDVM